MPGMLAPARCPTLWGHCCCRPFVGCRGWAATIGAVAAGPPLGHTVLTVNSPAARRHKMHPTTRHAHEMVAERRRTTYHCQCGKQASTHFGSARLSLCVPCHQLEPSQL